MIHQRVSVFCASSAKVHPDYFEAAGQLGQILARKGIGANYGGGAVGLMGALADAMLSEGGEIRGYIPRFMVDEGWLHPGIEDVHVVGSIHDRMQMLTNNVDAFITLPGGVGTLEELLEMITLKQLGQLFAPIIIVNINGYFDPLLDMLDKMIREQFMREIHRNIWTVVDRPEEVLQAINTSPGWDGSAIKYAPV